MGLREFSKRVETVLGGWRVTGTADGLTGVALERAEPDPAAARPPATPMPWFSDAADRIRRHLAGEPVTYDDLPRVVPSRPFEARVHAALARVRWGETITYGELAERAGSPGAARAVGAVMARNPLPLVIPCHRVLPAGGGLGGFSAPGGTATKFRLLHLEDAHPGSPAVGAVASLGEPLMADAAHHWLASIEPRLAPLLERHGVWRPTPRFPSQPFAALAQAVVYQQLAGAAAAAIFRRLQGLFHVSEDAFPTPEELAAKSLTELRGPGLSAAKAGTLLALARRAGADGDLGAAFLEDGPWDRVADALLSIRGVGPWTVEMFGIFHRGHPDLLPVGDLGIRRAAGQLFGDGREMTTARLARLGQRWRPFRTVVTWHLWRSDGLVTM